MNKALSVGLLAGGILLIIFGIDAMNSLGSEISQFFGGAPTDRSIWMLVGGSIMAIAGLVGVLPGLKKG